MPKQIIDNAGSYGMTPGDMKAGYKPKGSVPDMLDKSQPKPEMKSNPDSVKSSTPNTGVI